MDYKFFMQEIDAEGRLIDGTKKDLEVDFDGFRYCSIKGLEKVGKPRVYTESFAERDKINVYLPETITNEPTVVELKAVFVGENRYATYEAFREYLRNGFHRYWDTARNVDLDFFVKDEIYAQDEDWKAPKPYFRVTFRLNNIYGKTKKHV